MQKQTDDLQKDIIGRQRSDLLSGKWYLKMSIRYSSDLIPTVEHPRDNIWDFSSNERIIIINGYHYDPFSNIYYYLRKSTLFMYQVSYDDEGVMYSHGLDAYIIDNLTTDQLRLRMLFSSVTDEEQSFLIFTRQKPCYNETPEWKWMQSRRWTSHVIPLLERACDLSAPVGQYLSEQWGPMQADPDE